MIHEKKEPESGEKRRAEAEAEEDDDEEARARAPSRNAEDDKAKDKNDDEDDDENLNEMQKLQKDAMAVYNARVGKRGGDETHRIARAQNGKSWSEVSRNYRERFEELQRERRPSKNMPIPIDHLLERTQRRAAVINPSTIIIIIITITSITELTKSPAGQLEHYQTILKATQLLVQKERQKALVMKILQHAPRIPDTPSDFEALISGKDACRSISLPRFRNSFLLHLGG